jgi:hypothetical protein
MLTNLAIDTLLAARHLNQGREINSLGHVCHRLGIRRGRSHRAADDARVAGQVFFALLPELRAAGVLTVGDVVETRIGASATQLVAEPSSVVLDMLSRAMTLGAVVELEYSRPPGDAVKHYRIRPVEMLADRELAAVLVRSERTTADSDGVGDADISEKTRWFRIADILRLDFEGKTFWSPWTSPEGPAGQNRPLS